MTDITPVPIVEGDPQDFITCQTAACADDTRGTFPCNDTWQGPDLDPRAPAMACRLWCLVLRREGASGVYTRVYASLYTYNRRESAGLKGDKMMITRGSDPESPQIASGSWSVQCGHFLPSSQVLILSVQTSGFIETGDQSIDKWT